MVCMYCSSKTEVTNSRLQKRTNTVWRRRQCLSCKSIVSTIEQVDYEKSWVVQYSDTSLQPFLRDKLFVSIYKSCQHRPTALPDALGLTTTVIAACRPLAKSGSLPVRVIASQTLRTLQRFDQAAAIHYQAFHPAALK